MFFIVQRKSIANYVMGKTFNYQNICFPDFIMSFGVAAMVVEAGGGME